MSEKIFSGKSSVKFWEAVNRCSFEKKDKTILYEYGCKAQEIEQQRNDLLVACKELVGWEEQEGSFGGEQIMKKVKAAIAKCEA